MTEIVCIPQSHSDMIKKTQKKLPLSQRLHFGTIWLTLFQLRIENSIPTIHPESK